MSETLLAAGWTQKQVAALEAHRESIEESNGYDYADNDRFARVGNAAEEAEYEAAYQRGCCGSYDAVIKCSDGDIMYGFNYGH